MIFFTFYLKINLIYIKITTKKIDIKFIIKIIILKKGNININRL